MVALTKKTKLLVVVAFVLVAIAAFTAGIVIWQTHDKKQTEVPVPGPVDPSTAPLGVYSSAAVSSDAPYCSEIGKDVMAEGGNVVDAAIATLFCMGVVHSQSMGLGGGFLMVIYNATEKQSHVLNAREKAPAKATEDMFQGDPALAARGPLSVAVTGELLGYWELYNKYGGGVEWSRLVQPTIALCKNGFRVSRHAAGALWSSRTTIKNTPSMAEVFIDKTTGEVFLQNDTIRRPVLASTLERIANEGGDILHRNGSDLMQSFVADLKRMGGIIEEEDMINYYVEWVTPIKSDIPNGLTLHTVPPPGSGIILTFVLKLLSTYDFNPSMLENVADAALVFHRIVEAFKLAYAKRTLLGDPDPAVSDPVDVADLEQFVKDLTSAEYVDTMRKLINDDHTNNTYEYYGAEYYQPENHGTSHLSIIGSNGDAVAVTSTVNLYFGALIRSTSTGIIYNDEMDDFSAPNITNSFNVPPSPRNFIRPGKRPVSSMAPAIFTDSEGKARLIIGGAGGTRITTSVAYVSIRNLWFNETIKQAIDARRVHHQLFPMEVEYENEFPEVYVKDLEKRNHTTTSTVLVPPGAVVCGIAIGNNGTIYANSDFRKEGTIAGY